MKSGSRADAQRFTAALLMAAGGDRNVFSFSLERNCELQKKCYVFWVLLSLAFTLATSKNKNREKDVSLTVSNI